MQFVFFDPLCPDGLECSQSHVQGDLCGFYAALFHARKNCRGEVQPSRWGGHRSAFLCINGLVALPVPRSVRAVDVRRQRNVADALDQGKEVGNHRETDRPFSKSPAVQHLRLKLIVLAEEQCFADPDLPAWADQALPDIGLQ